VSSTTIRYSGVPENSHSGDLTDRTNDYTTGRAADRNTGRAADRKTADPAALCESGDGFYDWAGRRLFLSDGSPDPLTPGAYRYQASPDYCDLEAPESDPSSPRYEPPHLRHQPGDTWLIDTDRPYDPDDPGPFGSPGWRPDSRTGRHRRDELPDPIPPWQRPSEPTRDEHGDREPAPSGDHRTGRSPAPTREPADREPEPERETQAGSSIPPWRPKRHILRGSPDPEEPQGDPSGETGAGPRPRLPVEPDRPRPQPRGRSRFWSETDRNADDVRAPAPQHDRSAVAPDEPHLFDKLREDAWDRFIEDSEHLAAANRANLSALEREGGWQIALWVRFFRWLVAVLNLQRPRRTAATAAPTRVGVPVQRGAASRSVPTADRHTHLAARTALLGRAVRGAQRARAVRGAERAGVERGAAWA
jgi:hypothetical protein